MSGNCLIGQSCFSFLIRGKGKDLFRLAFSVEQIKMAPKAQSKLPPKVHREPKEEAVERVKRILFLKGKNSSQAMNDVMSDLALLSKPHCKVLSRKNDILPFEDPHSLEFLGPKNDCGMFTLVSHSKKRPDNLILVSIMQPCLLPLIDVCRRYSGKNLRRTFIRFI